MSVSSLFMFEKRKFLLKKKLDIIHTKNFQKSFKFNLKILFIFDIIMKKRKLVCWSLKVKYLIQIFITFSL